MFTPIGNKILYLNQESPNITNTSTPACCSIQMIPLQENTSGAFNVRSRQHFLTDCISENTVRFIFTVIPIILYNLL